MTMQHNRTLDGPMSDDEAAATFGDEAPPTDDIDGTPAARVVAEDSDAPEWAPPVPAGLRIPVGAQVTWLRIRAAWTAAPYKGDRVLLCWPLNEIEEGQALQRARGEQHRLVNELAKATVRLVDGAPADRTGTPNAPASVAALWRDLGPKGRHLVRTYYTRAHSLSDEETQDFFLNCVASRTAAPG